MDRDVRNLINIGIAWCGPVFVLTYLVFWIFMGHNSPPPNFVGMTPQELVSEHYGKYQTSISIGMAMSTVIGLLYLPWTCLLASMMKETEGGSNVLSNMELMGGTLTAWLLAFCCAIWLVCATQVNVLAAEVIYAIHAFTWYIYDMTYMITTIQLTGLGLWTIFNKKQTMFPVWAGWAAIAVGIIFLPLTLIAYVPDGPFAVGGVWNFYIVFGTWGFAFFTPYSYYMLKALYSERREIKMVAATA